MDWDADESEMLARIAMAEAEGEDVEGKALVMLVVLNRVWSCLSLDIIFHVFMTASSSLLALTNMYPPSTFIIGEDVEGKALVMLVVLNRVWSDKFPDSIEEVITQERQFTSLLALTNMYPPSTFIIISCSHSLSV